MVNLGVTLAGVALKNPVIPASGAFGYGREFAEVYDLDILGSFSFKGTTAQARFGNPQPRIAETACGMLNAVGLQNPGIDAVIAEELPNIAKLFHGPVIANIGGNTVEEYAENCRKLDVCPQVGIIEVNISCPNVHCGGKNFGSDPKSAAEVTAAVKAATKKPVFLKLSPNVTDIAEIAKACADAGADGLCLINTLLGMRIDLKTKRPLLANRTGGLSGPAVFPVALRMVWDVYEAVKLPIIGCGGISSAEDVCEMMLAGASAVEIGAANLKNPATCKTIIEKLPAVCERMGVTEISQLTGGAHA
ncbi:MAG: dihydroorotate dehydrogenase [Oscillibacter ruminantium]|uniref:dihydroorotate dehydrogenase n=1 Tax=Oscillibacter ruminantium TaxID=1263547 RepID=UPI002B1F9AFD|nr:dihydroorotate dehydrogenase [Oscillibacter ruminantium]MEA5041950.1 dihydroorotate dehydrogenase [Oscillibacter ruminantium]